MRRRRRKSIVRKFYAVAREHRGFQVGFLLRVKTFIAKQWPQLYLVRVAMTKEVEGTCSVYAGRIW